MRFWRENKNILTGIAVALLSILAGWYVVVRPIARAETLVNSKYGELAGKLEEQRRGPYDLEDMMAKLRSSNQKLAADIEGLKERVQISFHEWTGIPENYAKDPGSYFRLMHAKQQQDLYTECVKAQVTLSDEWLGFKGVLDKEIDDKAAQKNLNRLSIINRLVTLLAVAGTKEIATIDPAEPVQTGAEGYSPFIREYPVRITVRTGLDELMKFLHAVRKREQFLVVRDLHVAGGDPYRGGRGGDMAGHELTVTIDAAGMRFISEEERRKSAGPRRPRKPKGPIKASPPGGW